MPPKDLPATIPASSGVVVRKERNATMLLDEQEVAVKLDGEGFLTRIRHRLRLHYGPELYAAVKPGMENADTKVTMYAPGYQRYVQAVGGQLLCPPAMKDPVTGAYAANPLVVTYPGSNLIRSVTAAAVCAARNPLTGEWCVSVQTVTYDVEHILRQKLLKIEIPDVVKVLSQEDVDDARQKGELRGWSVLPLAPPFAFICANMSKAAVREAYQDFQNLAQTARQRACSKAERLAADHNPVVRRVWMYGDLKGGGDVPLFVEVPIVTWVEHRGRNEMEAWIQKLATDGRADGVSEVIVGDHVEDNEPEPDDALDPEAAAAVAERPVVVQVQKEAPKAIAERLDVQNPALPPEKAKEPVRVVEIHEAEEKSAPTVSTVEPPVAVPVEVPAEAPVEKKEPPAIVKASKELIEKCKAAERRSPPGDVVDIREKLGVGHDLARYDENVVKTYLSELNDNAQKYEKE